MRNLSKYDDCDLVWACLRYCEGKPHLNFNFINGVWEYLQNYQKITEKQRKAIESFVRREKIDVEKWQE